MKKIIIKTTIFIAIVALITVFLFDDIFISEDRKSYQKVFKEFYQDHIDSLDILIIGSSHARNGYNPNILDKVFKTSSYNLASSGQQLVVSNYLFREVIKHKKPKLVIVDVFPGSIFSMEEKPLLKGAQLRVFDYTKPSVNKLKTINKIYSVEELPSVFSQTIRNHQDWYDANWLFEENNFLNKGNGFSGLHGEFKKQDRSQYEDYLKQYLKFSKAIPNADEVKSFENNNPDIVETLKICKENNINVIIVSAPYFPSFYNTHFNKTHYIFNQYFKEKNINFLDFNTLFNELDLTLNDFRDKGHLNAKGANKVSTYLSKYISDQGYLRVKNRGFLNSSLSKITPRNKDSILKQIEAQEESFYEDIVHNSVALKPNFEYKQGLKIKEILFHRRDNIKYLLIETNSQEKHEQQEQIINQKFLLRGKIYKKDFDKRPNRLLNTDKDLLFWRVSPEIIFFKEKQYIMLILPKNGDIHEFQELMLILIDNKNEKNLKDRLVLNDVKF